jgi:hypothetical protein
VSAVSKAGLLRELGYGGPLEAIEPLLEAAGLSRTGKPGIHPDKADAVRALIAENFVLVCGRGDCGQRALALAGEREIALAASPELCAVCGGSVIRSAVGQMLAACQRAAWTRLCVVGGSPNTRRQLEEAVAGRIALRLIDGLTARTRRLAQADLSWADHVVVWGSTQLAHKVSLLYQGAPNASTVNRRGVAELARHVARQAAGAGPHGTQGVRPGPEPATRRRG